MPALRATAAAMGDPGHTQLRRVESRIAWHPARLPELHGRLRRHLAAENQPYH